MALPRDFRLTLPPWVDDVIGTPREYRGAEEKMALAIRLAAENVERETGGGPFGAAVFRLDTGALVSVGMNSVVRLHNSALHAEIVALMLAHEGLGLYSFRAPGAPPLELVTSCQPCLMCFGMTLWSGVQRLICGATREDAMELGFDEGPLTEESYRHLQEKGIEVVRGILRPEARAVLRRYQQLGRPVY